RLKTLLDGGAVGKPDRARLVYGNGTVRDWLGTWREAGTGVLEDLGCHVLDLGGWLLGRDDDRYLLWDLRPVESATFDYEAFSTADRRVVYEIGTVFAEPVRDRRVWLGGVAALARPEQVGRCHARAPHARLSERCSAGAARVD